VKAMFPEMIFNAFVLAISFLVLDQRYEADEFA